MEPELTIRYGAGVPTSNLRAEEIDDDLAFGLDS